MTATDINSPIEQQDPRFDISPDFQQMLEDIDERVCAFELSEGYAASLTSHEWVALRQVLLRNDVPLRIAGTPRRNSRLRRRIRPDLGILKAWRSASHQHSVRNRSAIQPF